MFALFFILGGSLYFAHDFIIVAEASISHFLSRLSVSYILKLLLRNLVFRLIIFAIALVVLPMGYISLLVFNKIVGGLLLFYYFYIILLRYNRTPLLYNVITLCITLGFLAFIFWGLAYGFSLLLGETGLSSFGFLLMSDDGSGSPGSSPSSSEGNNGGSGGESPDPGNNNEDVPLDEGDVPEPHGPRALCTHESFMGASDLESLENKEDIQCDMNPAYQGEGRPLVSHSAFPPDGDPPVLCSNCHALICHNCATGLDVSSDASLGDSPPANYPRGYHAYMESLQRDNPYGEGPSGGHPSEGNPYGEGPSGHNYSGGAPIGNHPSENNPSGGHSSEGNPSEDNNSSDDDLYS